METVSVYLQQFVFFFIPVANGIKIKRTESIQQLKQYDYFRKTKWMGFVLKIAAGIKIPLFIFPDDDSVSMIPDCHGGFDHFVLSVVEVRLMGPQFFLRNLKGFR